MASWRTVAPTVLSAACLVAPIARAEETIPPADRRAVEVRTLDSPCPFAPYADREAWLTRARFLREQVLVSAGLWPMPEKGPLNAHVFGRVEHGDYSVEKAPAAEGCDATTPTRSATRRRAANTVSSTDSVNGPGCP